MNSVYPPQTQLLLEDLWSLIISSTYYCCGVSIYQKMMKCIIKKIGLRQMELMILLWSFCLKNQTRLINFIIYSGNTYPIYMRSLLMITRTFEFVLQATAMMK